MHPTKPVGKFEPLHDAHAIDQVAIVINFVSPLNKDSFDEVKKIGESLKEELPGSSPIHTFMVALSQTAVLPGGSGAGQSRTFHRQDGTVERELRLEASALTFRTTSYTRWDAIWKKAFEYFQRFLPIYSQVPIESISLQYVDRFIWHGVPAEADPFAVIRKDCHYLPRAAEVVGDLWHVHFGSYQRAADGARRLVNINTDFVQEVNNQEMRRAINVLTIVTDSFNVPGYSELQLAREDVDEFVEKRAKELHAASSDLLREILSDSMAQRIALKE